MSIVNSIVFDEICQRGCLRCRDVQRLKNLFYASEFIDIKEAESLFEINDACRVQDIQWAEFFIDAICNFTIDHLEPEGCVTLSNAEWLMSVIAKDCAIQTQTEFELLLTLLDRARWSSENLIMFALHQIRIAIISGSGPLRAHCAPQPGVVMKQDVAALRRVFYSTAGDRHIAVTQSEAGVLFEINDATADAENCAEWSEFFAKAITNSMMAASGYRVPLRQHVLGCEPLLQEQSALPDDCRAISSGIVLDDNKLQHMLRICLLYTSPSPRDA